MNGYEFIKFDNPKGQLNSHVAFHFSQGKCLTYTFFGSCFQAFTERELIDLRDKINDSLSYYRTQGLTDKDIEAYNAKNIEEVERAYEESEKRRREERKNNPEPKGYVYLIQNTESNALKIGYSKNPKARLQQLNIASHEKLEIVDFIEGTTTEEKRLHKKFKKLRLNSEWFSYSEEIIKQFQTTPDNGRR